MIAKDYLFFKLLNFTLRSSQQQIKNSKNPNPNFNWLLIIFLIILLKYPFLFYFKLYFPNDISYILSLISSCSFSILIMYVKSELNGSYFNFWYSLCIAISILIVLFIFYNLGIQKIILDFLTSMCSLFLYQISNLKEILLNLFIRKWNRCLFRLSGFIQELKKLSLQFLEDKQKIPLGKKSNDSYNLNNDKKNFLYLLKKDNKVSLPNTNSTSSLSNVQSNTNVDSNSINPKQNKKSIKEEFVKWLNLDENKNSKTAFEKPTIDDIKKKVLDEEDAFQKEMPDMQKRFNDLISKNIKNYEEKIKKINFSNYIPKKEINTELDKKNIEIWEEVKNLFYSKESAKTWLNFIKEDKPILYEYSRMKEELTKMDNQNNILKKEEKKITDKEIWEIFKKRVIKFQEVEGSEDIKKEINKLLKIQAKTSEDIKKEIDKLLKLKENYQNISKKN